ncbi:NAD(P)H-binding protein [Actinomadura barringtoniae]|uniref:NAD(P)H-binding protein n=1 Tax=Actinomadura barringtoniae TaxID=1427535 RepID=A0A939T9L1_9ACTN|nr:NAD(P)H-binding protein [Actinomadura barringtoniae]MBO2454389.1 NAD(P)H-binding protein [Actinomadura barringtoniae]
MYLVAGATGNVGSEVVKALAAAGEPTRALVRDPESANAKLPEGVEAVAGDLNKPETLTSALYGVRSVFLLPGYADMPGVLAEAKKAGVEQVVQLTGGSAGNSDMSNAVTRYMAATETAVKESGLPWTFLRPTAFMTNALRWLPQLQAGDEVRVSFPNVLTASVDPFDLGAIAARAMLTDEYRGEILWPTGPVALRPAEQVLILGAALGRDLRAVELSNEEAREEMTASMPVEYVDAFFDFYVNGALDESIVRPTVKEVTGREPRTFADWAAAHTTDFS